MARASSPLPSGRGSTVSDGPDTIVVYRIAAAEKDLQDHGGRLSELSPAKTLGFH
jgi:hypothetical protein